MGVLFVLGNRAALVSAYFLCVFAHARFDHLNMVTYCRVFPLFVTCVVWGFLGICYVCAR